MKTTCLFLLGLAFCWGLFSCTAQQPKPEEVIEIMEKLGIEHCMDKFPFEMSGGEKQRVSLARALVNNPAVILADEPTGNLDAETSSEVAALLRNASDMFGQTIVMVTHDRQMADFADRVLVIKDGVVR